MKKLCVLLFLSTVWFAPNVALADSIILGPNDFVPESDTTKYFHSTEILYAKAGSGNGEFYAPVHLPDGANITSVVLFYKDSSITGSVEMLMYKKNIYNLDSIVMCYYFSTQSTPGLFIQKIAPITGGNKVNNSGYFYNVKIQFPDTSLGDECAVYAVKIMYK